MKTLKQPTILDDKAVINTAIPTRPATAAVLPFTQQELCEILGVERGDIGNFMRKAVRKAIDIIRVESRDMKGEAKIGYGGNLDDIVTSGDYLAQVMYEAKIRKQFPLFGIIGEENGLRVLCKILGHDVYFSVDSLDGTKAHWRKQSHGVGSMLALIVDGVVVAVCIGDVNTGEIFFFDATFDKPGIAHRIRFDYDHQLLPKTNTPLRDQYIYTRRHTLNELPWVQRFIAPKKFGGFFRELEVSGGSIGTSIARLWKGEVGAAILDPGYKTPWDVAPVVGLCKWLGFKLFTIHTAPMSEEGGQRPTLLTEDKRPLSKKVVKNDYGTLIIHESYVDELLTWLDEHTAKLLA